LDVIIVLHGVLVLHHLIAAGKRTRIRCSAVV